MEYQSTVCKESRVCPGVRFQVRRLSLARRMELVREIRSAGAQLEFHAAGAGLADQVEAASIRATVDAIYLRWGIAGIEGLSIDGEPATVESFIAAGPDGLAREMADAVHGELFLSEDERKN
ncbi:MAG: hypothetical protein FJW30_24735 [Acidobacteria bacterium]|nr:hypothetical protein [Acidobacteriota bacterium]